MENINTRRWHAIDLPLILSNQIKSPRLPSGEQNVTNPSRTRPLLFCSTQPRNSNHQKRFPIPL